MMLASWWEQRRHGKAADKAAIKAFREDLTSLVAEGTSVAEAEVVARPAEQSLHSGVSGGRLQPPPPHVDAPSRRLGLPRASVSAPARAPHAAP